MRLSVHPVKPRSLLIILLLLTCLLMVTGILEYTARRRSVLTLMAGTSANLARIIEQSAVNAILSYDLLENQLIDQLGDVLTLLDRLPTDQMTPQIINQIQTSLASCDWLEIYNASGTLLYPPDTRPLLENPHQYLPAQDVVISTAYVRDPVSGQQLLGVFQHGAHQRMLVAYLAIDRLLSIRKRIGVGSLLNSLTQDSAITYIAIQDSLGILAATRLIDTLSALAGDHFIERVLRSREFGWRITEFRATPIFEGVRPFQVETTSYGVIRIGLNYQPIAQIQRAAVRQLVLRLGILTVLGFIILAYTIAVQNVRLLESEKDKITKEVLRLQTDLQQKERLSAMGELAAGVAHEIRNPLNAISMTAQLLERELDENSEQQQQLALVRREIARIQEIIQQFLVFARPTPLHRRPVDIGEIVQQTVQVHQARAVSQNVSIDWQKPPGLKANLDPAKITTCLSNLLENALDAMPAGGRLTLTLVRRRRTTYLTVSDTGVGIPPAVLPKIFNLYFTTKPAGTGLGLAQVYQIVSEHGGTIEVTSQPGGGTTFKLTFPD